MLATALAITGGIAPAARGSEIHLGLSSRDTGTRTALTLHLRYTKPGDPKAKPPPIRHLDIEAPAGTTFHSARVTACSASDEEVRARGTSACPESSKIGDGTVRVLTGFGPPFDPFDSPTPVYNDGRGWLEISQTPSSPATIAVTRLAVTRNRISGDIAETPGGPPDGQTAVSTAELAFPASTGYVTTPPTCPPSGKWVTTALFVFGDGTRESVRDETPCNSGALAAAPSVRVTPAVVRAGRRTRVRVGVGGDARCASGAMVRIRGLRGVVRTDRHGRASLVAVFRRSGRRSVVARKAGCPRRTGSLRILARRQRP